MVNRINRTALEYYKITRHLKTFYSKRTICFSKKKKTTHTHTCDFRIVRAPFNVFVTELHGYSILAGCRWQIRHGHSAVLVVVTTDLRLARTFYGQR